jgi:arylmalonate decarboxylase
VGTAYDDAMNACLREYLDASGFEVAALVGMNIRKVREAMAVTDPAMLELAHAASKQAAKAEAVLISCGAFATAHLRPEMEKRCGLPVVSTTPATIAAALRSIAP